MTIECFVLLLFMMNSQQQNEDERRAIEAYSGDSKFRNLLKNILNKGTGKKVENFLNNQQMMAMHDYQKDPELRKNLMEIINTPGYDPDSVREAQRQIIRMNQGLPRFPTA